MVNRTPLFQKPGFMPVLALVLATVGVAGVPRLYNMLRRSPKSFPERKALAPEFVKICETLKAQKQVRISQENSWDMWKSGSLFGFAGKTKSFPSYFFNGKRYFYFDAQHASVSNKQDDLRSQNPIGFLGGSLYYLNLKYWSEVKHVLHDNVLKIDLLEVGINPQHMEIEFDPKTWLPKKQVLTRNVFPTTPSEIRAPIKQETLVFNYDYRPIAPEVFTPKIPTNLPCTDYDATRAREWSELKNPLVTFQVDGQKLEIRRIRLNSQGDLLIDYTGPFPDTPLKSSAAAPKRAINSPPVPVGKLDISDSLGNKTGDDKDGFYKLPALHSYHPLFAGDKSHPLSQCRLMMVRCSDTKKKDLRPRTICLRLEAKPKRDQNETKTYVWTSPLLAPGT